MYASRRRRDSQVLSSATWPAKILSINNIGNRGKQIVTLQYDKHKNYSPIDTIPFVPKGTKGESTTVIKRNVNPDVNSTNSVAELPPTTPNVPVRVSQSTPSASTPSASTPSASLVPILPNGLRSATSVSVGFVDMRITDILNCEIPQHIVARWTQIDEQLRVGQLFGSNSRANIALRDVRLSCLRDYTGQDEYMDVPVKTKNAKAPNMGLLELCAHKQISGRTMRAKTKGMMFAFLACVSPDDVVFPPFVEKRGRSAPFSLSEKGRLVAVIKDPSNLSTVSMLMKKWSRADMDAKAGQKGIRVGGRVVLNLLIPPPPHAPQVSLSIGARLLTYSTTPSTFLLSVPISQSMCRRAIRLATALSIRPVLCRSIAVAIISGPSGRAFARHTPCSGPSTIVRGTTTPIRRVTQAICRRC